MFGSRPGALVALPIALVALALLAGCTSSISADDVNFTPEIDGAAPEGVSISIPRNALPDGVSTDDIVVTALEFESPASVGADVPTAPEFALSFEPDGLQLNEPVTISFPIDDQSALRFALHYSGDSIESTPIELLEGDGEPRAQIQIEHFSRVVLWHFGAAPITDVIAGSASTEVSPAATQVLVGDTVEVDTTLIAGGAGPFEGTAKILVFSDGAADTNPNSPTTRSPLNGAVAELEVSISPGTKHVWPKPWVQSAGPVSPFTVVLENNLKLESNESWFPDEPAVFTCDSVGTASFRARTFANVSATATITAASDPALVGLGIPVSLTYWPYGVSVSIECVGDLPSAEVTPVNDGAMQVNTLVLGGQHYAVEQFTEADPDVVGCLVQHWHSGATVFSFEGLREDPSGQTGGLPDSEGCGFGAVSDVPQELFRITPAEFTNYREVLASQ